MGYVLFTVHPIAPDPDFDLSWDKMRKCVLVHIIKRYFCMYHVFLLDIGLRFYISALVSPTVLFLICESSVRSGSSFAYTAAATDRGIFFGVFGSECQEHQRDVMFNAEALAAIWKYWHVFKRKEGNI